MLRTSSPVRAEGRSQDDQVWLSMFPGILNPSKGCFSFSFPGAPAFFYFLFFLQFRNLKIPAVAKLNFPLRMGKKYPCLQATYSSPLRSKLICLQTKVNVKSVLEDIQHFYS